MKVRVFQNQTYYLIYDGVQTRDNTLLRKLYVKSSLSFATFYHIYQKLSRGSSNNRESKIFNPLKL